MKMTADKGSEERRYTAADAYDRAACLYDSWHWQSVWHAVEEPIIAAAVRRHRTAASKVMVDVGCGTGRYLRAVGCEFSKSYGIDVSSKMIEKSQKRNGHSKHFVADAQDMQISSGTVDVLICARVLSHLHAAHAALREFNRVASSEGVVILADVSHEHEYDCTRLPSATGRIEVETYKYSAEQHCRALQNFGFELMEEHTLRRLTAAQSDGAASNQKPIGWVLVFRRGGGTAGT